MDAIGQFLSVTQRFREASGLKTTALSWRLFGDSKKLGAIEGGADIQVTRWQRALQWLSDNWPSDAEWPAGVPRPKPSDPTSVEPDPEPRSPAPASEVAA